MYIQRFTQCQICKLIYLTSKGTHIQPDKRCQNIKSGVKSVDSISDEHVIRFTNSITWCELYTITTLCAVLHGVNYIQ